VASIVREVETVLEGKRLIPGVFRRASPERTNASTSVSFVGVCLKWPVLTRFSSSTGSHRRCLTREFRGSAESRDEGPRSRTLLPPLVYSDDRGVHRAPEHPLSRMEAVVHVGVGEPVRDDHHIDVAHRAIAAMGS